MIVGVPGARYLSMFVRQGVPFGLMMALAFGVTDGATGAVLGLLGGVAFAAVVTLALGTIDFVDQRGHGGRWTRSGSPRQRLVVRSQAPAATLAEALRTAVAGLPAMTESDLLPDGPLVARTGTSWASWGERVTVELQPAPHAAADVVLTSDPVMPIARVDYGKARRNVSTLADAVASLAAKY
jgi:hypothetical protein